MADWVDLAYASMTANVKVLNKSSNNVTMYLTPTKRVIVTKDDAVSSISKSDINKISEQFKEGDRTIVSCKNGSEQKVATIDKVRVVTKNGERVLKLSLSNNDYTTKGTFANKTINYVDLANEEMKFVVFRRCRVVGARCPGGGRPCQSITSCG